MTLLTQLFVGTFLLFQGDVQPNCVPPHIPNPPFVTPHSTDVAFDEVPFLGDYYGIDIDPNRIEMISAIV